MEFHNLLLDQCPLITNTYFCERLNNKYTEKFLLRLSHKYSWQPGAECEVPSGAHMYLPCNFIRAYIRKILHSLIFLRPFVDHTLLYCRYTVNCCLLDLFFNIMVSVYLDNIANAKYDKYTLQMVTNM